VIAVELNVRDAFLAALMLTGTIDAAEQAVSEANRRIGMRLCHGGNARCDGEVRYSDRR
jgi:hypothetical protein